MKNKRIHRIAALFLAVLLCIPPMNIVSAEDELNVPEAVYENYGRDLMLPIAGELDVASTDYYYENKNDPLPGLHGGVDIICDRNTPILAVTDGTVYFAGSGGGYGNNVILEHIDENGEKFYSRYAHLNSYSVTKGAKVSKGQVIGYAGNTGTSTTNHLHLEVYNSEHPTNMERSYTTKYLLSLPVSELKRMSFYYHPINGEYNSQLRRFRLGSGGTCFERCMNEEMHDHISKYALYLEKFYNRSPNSWNCRYYFDEAAEAALFADPVLREHIYKRYDTDRDGHLSYVEVMRVTVLDLRGLNITSLDGLDLFENLSSILTGEGEVPLDPPDVILPEAERDDVTHALTAEYKIDPANVKAAGLLGLWEHIDTDGELPLRKNPVYNKDFAGAGIPHLGRFVVTETQKDATYTWGKTIYNGVEGWVIISNSAWTRQITSGVGTYTVDADGYLTITSTGERVTGFPDSKKTAAALFDISQIDCLLEGKSITAWSYNGTVAAENTKLTTIIPELRTGDTQAVFEAYFGEAPATPIHELVVELRLPEEGRADYGALGAWHFSAKVNLRKSPSADSEKISAVPADSTVTVTAVSRGDDYLWGKLTYNGTEGWCALSDEWAKQLTCGYGRYAVDKDGYIILTDTGERVRAVYRSDMQVSELPDLAEMQLIGGLYVFGGWSADGVNALDREALLSDAFPELKEGDHTVELTALLPLDSSPDLTVSYKLPASHIKDAGMLGLWEHIDTNGELPLRVEPVKNNNFAGMGIPHLGKFTVTEIKTDSQNTWGKTTYNGVSGWVIISNAAWTRQITSGTGTYSTDEEGCLIYTATGERVQSELDADMTVFALLDGAGIDCIKESSEFVTWQYLGSALSGTDTPLAEIFPLLTSKKLSITLTAQVKNKINTLTVNYSLPKEYVKDAGAVGLWKHTDTIEGLSIRADHNAKTEKLGAVPPLTLFILTETYNDGQYLWGKTTYNGVTGWCWIDAEWAEQLTSGVGTYTADSEGNLIYTATGERVQGTFDSTMTADGLLDGNSIDCFAFTDSFYAWKYGDTVITDMNTLLTEIIPSLSEADTTVTLTAVMKEISTSPDDPTAVHKLNVSYKIPLDAVADAGYLGLWKHTDIEGGLTLRSGHSTSSGKIGSILPQAEFIVTEFYVGTDYIWGKTVYGGITGWCALSAEWAVQLTSGVGTYTVDAEGYIIYTATGERVSAELDSTAKIADLLAPSLITFMKDELALDGWSADGKYISDTNAHLTELIPALAEGDVTLTLTARMTGVAGDADGDGSVNEHDLDLLVRYLSGYNDNLALDNLDVDKNGKINTRDFILVREMI